MKEAMIYLVKDAFTTSLTICKGLYAYLGKAILKMYAFLIVFAIFASLYTFSMHDFVTLMFTFFETVPKLLPHLVLASILLFGLCFVARLTLTSIVFAGRILR